MEQSEASFSKRDKWEVKYPWYDPPNFKSSNFALFLYML